ALSAATSIGGPAVFLLPQNIQQAALDPPAQAGSPWTPPGLCGGGPPPRGPPLRGARGPPPVIARGQGAPRAPPPPRRRFDGGRRKGARGEGRRRVPRVAGIGRDRRDGSSLGARRTGRERGVFVGGHAAAPGRTQRSRRSAGIDADRLDRLGAAVRAVYARGE